MIDTLLANKEKADDSKILDNLNLNVDGFAVLTLHRPANVDDAVVFNRILDALEVIQKDMPIIFPIHPRTFRNLKSFDLAGRFKQLSNLRLIAPLGYLDFLNIISSARVVLTDSGGIQEETTILKVPCLTLRENTERPVTVEMGSNQIVGTNPTKIIEAYKQVITSGVKKQENPPLWDGHTAERITGVLINLERNKKIIELTAKT